MIQLLKLFNQGGGRSILIVSALCSFVASLFTLVSIPLIIPFFQILFGVSPGKYEPPAEIWNLQAQLNYAFTRLIAISDRKTALVFICSVVVIVFFFKNLFRYASSYLLAAYRNTYLATLRARIWSASINLNITHRNHLHSAEVTTLLSNDIEQIDHGLLKAFELLFRAPLVIIGSFIFMAWLSPFLTFISLFLILFIFVIIGGLRKVLKADAVEIQSSIGDMNALMEERLANLRIDKAHQTSAYADARFNKLNSILNRALNRLVRKRDLASPLSEILAMVVIVFLLYYGTNEVLSSNLSPETFFAFILAFYYLIEPAKNFSREYANIQRGLVSLDRVENFEQLAIVTTKLTANEKLDRFQILTFSDVSFAYQETPILSNVNFTIRTGDRVAIVGESGVGKSTLIDLIIKLIAPDHGRIEVNHINIENIDPLDWSKQMGVVTQNSLLYDDTIIQNIILGSATEDLAMLSNALHISGLDKVFDKDPSMRSNKIGQSGMRLSGGERQRISLARALYRNPALLLLDEPTSQLDSESKSQLFPAIYQMMKDRTTILVTHDLELLKYVDRILFLKHGKIQEYASLENLPDSVRNYLI